ncbi:MAG: hypothetical protein V7607_6138 [Solirubrobacteraceae bacterium]
MSEVPRERRSAGGSVAKDEAWRTARSAQEAWAGAMRTHALAPPDAGFRDRVRSLADAAAAMRDAHARALESGLAWRPIKGAEHARPPYELRPGTGRRGPDELWTRFDEAVAQLNEAGAGDNLAAVVAGYAAIAEAARALADALEAARE